MHPLLDAIIDFTVEPQIAAFRRMVRPDAGIDTPKDLEGRLVGVRAYSVTTGVWTRVVLIDEYGVDSSKVTWVVDDEEHVMQPKLMQVKELFVDPD